MGNSSAELERFWATVLEDLHTRTPKRTLETWLKNISPVAIEDRTVVLAVPNEFAKEWLENAYYEVIQESLSNVMDQDVIVQFVVHRRPEPPEELSQGPTEPLQQVEGASRSELDIGFYLMPLNKRYTFANFVVGNSNRFAQAASLAVATNPGRKYNPLFLHGGVGLGKTHLMQAIGHYVRDKSPENIVAYVPGETFVFHVVSSIRENETELFRKRYRNVDIWLVDDVQYIASKERTEAEFFHTFNALFQTNKQIVITSDCPPKELQLINDRLRSRFESGLIVDIAAPDMETRIAILQKRLEEQETTLPYEVLSYLANLIHSNIRVLEGALMKLLAHASLTGEKITLPVATQLLADYATGGGPFRITIERIMRIVCEHFGISHEDMVGRSRNKPVVIPRQIAMYLCRELTESSLPEIGKAFGGRDHSTVIHAHAKIKEMVHEDPATAALLQDLAEKAQRVGV